jgi:hypothetical protein
LGCVVQGLGGTNLGGLAVAVYIFDFIIHKIFFFAFAVAVCGAPFFLLLSREIRVVL